MAYGHTLVSRSHLGVLLAWTFLQGGGCSPASPGTGSPGAPGAPPEAAPITHTLTWHQDPGTEIVQCHTFKLDADTPIDVERIKFAFGDGSHHVHVYRSSEPADDGVQDCSGGINWPRWLLVVGAQTKPLDWQLPSGLTLPLQAKQQILVQVHWLNTTAAPIDGRIDLSFYPAAHAGQPVGVVFGINKQVGMQPSETKRVSHFCPLPAGSEVIAMMGHFHALGRAYGVWLRGADQTDADGTEIYRGLDENTLVFQSFEPHVMVGPDQGLEFQCDFVNTRDIPVTWGPDTSTQEHCNMAAYYYPAPPDANGFCIKEPDDVGTLTSLRAAASELQAGETTDLSVEMAAPVEVDTDVALTASDPTALEVPATARIAAHARSATVTARALRPVSSATVTAALAGQTAAASLAVRGLLLSELLVRPDPTGGMGGQEPWIEIANTSGQPIDLGPYRIAVSAAGSADINVPLAGTLGPHGCLVVTAAVPPPMDGATLTMTGLPSALPMGLDSPAAVDLVDAAGVQGGAYAGLLDSATYGDGGGDARAPMRPGTSLLRLSPDSWQQAVVPTPGICEIRP
jgi:hypothetical protein